MRVYDGTYRWRGWGGPLALGSGRCRLSIFDLRKGGGAGGPAHLRPFVVVVSDFPDSVISVRSCAGHVATSVAREFGIPPNRMIFVEYYPEITYGRKNEFRLSEKLDMVVFEWIENRAIRPKWREMPASLEALVRDLIRAGHRHMDDS